MDDLYIPEPSDLGPSVYYIRLDNGNIVAVDPDKLEAYRYLQTILSQNDDK